MNDVMCSTGGFLDIHFRMCFRGCDDKMNFVLYHFKIASPVERSSWYTYHPVLTITILVLLPNVEDTAFMQTVFCRQLSSLRVLTHCVK